MCKEKSHKKREQLIFLQYEKHALNLFNCVRANPQLNYIQTKGKQKSLAPPQTHRVCLRAKQTDKSFEPKMNSFKKSRHIC